MRYLEDLISGVVVDCGSYIFSRDEIVSFAHRYDPQPFHINDEMAGHGLFGRLIASGLHSASASRRLVLQTVMQDIFLIGSPGVKRMQMHKPVYSDSAIRVTHTTGNIELLEEWPGVGLVESLTQGFDAGGNLVITIDGLDWVGSQTLPTDFDVTPLRMSQSASMGLRALRRVAEIAPSSSKLGPGKRLYLEDCHVDLTIVSGEYEVRASDMTAFRAEFDPLPSNGGSRFSANEWLGICLAGRIFADTFWSHTEIVGGAGTNFVRWPGSVQAGDYLRGELRITHARSLRTRPGLGLIEAENVCINQRAEVISNYSTIAFIRMQAEA